MRVLYVKNLFYLYFIFIIARYSGHKNTDSWYLLTVCEIHTDEKWTENLPCSFFHRSKFRSTKYETESSWYATLKKLPSKIYSLIVV